MVHFGAFGVAVNRCKLDQRKCLSLQRDVGKGYSIQCVGFFIHLMEVNQLCGGGHLF